MKADLLARVKRIVAEATDSKEEEVTLQAHFVNDLGVNSINLVELKNRFEEEFEVSLPNEEVRGIRTLQGIIDYADRRFPRWPSRV